MSDLPDSFTDSTRERRGRPPLRVVQPTGDQPAPFSREAEEHVLACCLVDGGVTLARCQREKIAPDAFFLPGPRKIYETLVAMQAAARPITLEVLAEELRKLRELEAVGGFPFLLQITTDVPTTAHAAYFIDQLREQWVLRRLQRYGDELLGDIAKFTTGDLEAFAARHAVRFQRVADFVTRFNRPAASVEAAAARAQLEEILAGKIDRSRQLSLLTPYADQVLLPLDVKNEDWMIVVAGPPSGGKSSVARGLVAANLPAGKRGAVFLLETGKRRWQWALAATLAHVSLREILDAPDRVFPKSLENFKRWDEALTGWLEERLWIFDDIYYIEDVERTVRELDRSLREKEIAAGKAPDQARGLDFVVIDYLQLLNTREKILKREEQVAYLSRTCKRLFKALNLTGVALAQLNRRSRDEGRRPRLSDLRESGAIEQDADAVFAIHTPDKDRSGTPQDGERSIQEAELICLKRRNGPANLAIDLLFHKNQTRYEDMVRKGEARPGSPKPAEGYKRDGGAT